MRRHKVYNESLCKFTGPMKRLAKDNHAERVGKSIYQLLGSMGEAYLDELVKKSILVMEHAKRHVLRKEDILYVLYNGDTTVFHQTTRDKFYFPREPFKRVFKTHAYNYKAYIKVSEDALDLIQDKVERYMSSILYQAIISAGHAKRATIEDKDLKLASTICSLTFSI